jgi:thiol-disulfide isomerase/thioredoxin
LFLIALPLAALAEVDAAFADRVKALARGGNAEQAMALVEHTRGQVGEPTPEWLLSLSWVGRGMSFEKRWEQAEQYADETLRECEKLLKSRSLGANGEAPLPLALGAAIEVLGQARAAAGDRSGAVAFLKEQRKKYAGTVVETRTQKNLLLISLEGKPMPELEMSEHLGAKPPSLAELKGNVTLFFFWAHWCSDCKAQKPIIARLHEEYESKGLRVVGPTRLWGYTVANDNVTPQQELAYIKGPYFASNPLPEWMPAPLSTANFIEFGVSSTPTLVLVDRQGAVRLYHPGGMPYQDLKAAIEALL